MTSLASSEIAPESRNFSNEQQQQQQDEEQPQSLPVLTQNLAVEQQEQEQRPSYSRSTTINAERWARLLSNVIIFAGTITCLGVAVAAASHVDSESTIVFLLLVPTFFGGGCLLTLVNVSWISRRPGKRCSSVQVICNMVLLFMTLYVELIFWPYRRDLALVILCGAAFPMFLFVNLPSAFLQQPSHYDNNNTNILGGDYANDMLHLYSQDDEDDVDTVIMGDDEHSLFDTPENVNNVTEIVVTTGLEELPQPHNSDLQHQHQQAQTENPSHGPDSNNHDDLNNHQGTTDTAPNHY